MTTVFTQDVPEGPRVHAFVIGVGRYPHCGPTAADRLARRLTDLPGAAATAVSVAEWLITDQADDSDAPLASVEVLVSAHNPVVVNSHEVAVATRDNFEDAFARWYSRCDDPDAVAVFYFCGHGCARHSMQEMLLLEDFGKVDNSFAHSLDFSATYSGMVGCQALTQLFFVDTCREIPLEIEPYAQLDGYIPLSRKPPAGRTTDLVVYATQFGQMAYADPSTPTPFSAAVRRALAGGAASRSMDDRWTVTADLLANAVRQLMRHETADTATQQIVQTTGGARETVLRALTKPPDVPFVVLVIPNDAHGTATMRMTSLTDALSEVTLGPTPEPWRGEVPPGAYDLRLIFPEGAWVDQQHTPWILPPGVVGTFEATPS